MDINKVNKHKRIEIGLQKVYGIGKKESKKLYLQLGFNENMQCNEFNSEVEEFLLALVKGHLLEDSLRDNIKKNVILKGDIGSYAGLRHKQGLPVRGQRSKNNIVTSKKLNTFLLSKELLYSRMSSKDRRRAKRQDKREKKQERKKR